jgi:hypothetical protein
MLVAFCKNGVFVVQKSLTLERRTTYKDVSHLSPLKIKIPSKNMREKPTDNINYSFSLLIMSGSSYMSPHCVAIFRERS